MKTVGAPHPPNPFTPVVTMYPYVVALDCETAATDATLAMDPPEDFLMQGVQERFKEETVQRYRDENAKKWPQEAGKRGALDWRLGQVVATGFCMRTMDDDREPVVSVGLLSPPGYDGKHGMGWHWRVTDDARGPSVNRPLPAELENVGDHPVVYVRLFPTEQELLAQTWAHFDGLYAVTASFAGRTFDVPYLMGRSAVTGAGPVPRWQLNRYNLQDDPGAFVDWSDVLAWYGAFGFTGWTLARYADALNLPWHPVGDGAETGDRWRAGDLPWLALHQASDCLTTLALHERMAPAFLQPRRGPF